MKRSLVHAGLGAALLAGVTACGGGEAKTSLPVYTGGATPSATTTSQPPPTATATATGTSSGSDTLAAKSTYTYGGLTFVINLPTKISSASRPSLLLFSQFLQGVGSTTARNQLDPSLSSLTSTTVLKERRALTGGESVQGIGSVIETISTVRTSTSGVAVITGCLDQSKLVQVRKDGSRFVDAATKSNPTLKMTANIIPGEMGLRVARYSFAAGPC